MKRAVLFIAVSMITAVMLMGFAVPTFALVDIVNSPNSGAGVFQRNAENGTYTIKVFLDVKAAAHISALEANVTFDNTVFTNVSLSDQINASSGAIWETSEANASYQVVGNVTTVKYLKASTNGDYWSVAAGATPLLYTLTFRIKNDAPTGTVQTLFDSNFAKVQDDVSGNITGTLRNTVYSVILDATAPITSITNGIVAGWYAAGQSVNLDTNETNDEATINYTTDGSDPLTSPTVMHGVGQVLGISVPSTINGIRITTLNYYAQDWAKNAPSNVESPVQTQVYYVDTEFPTINSIVHTVGPIGIGGTVYVTFNISDASNLLYSGSYPLVNITGHGASKVTGNGMGVYVFSKVLASNDDNGSHYADITIQTRDRAGNTTTYTKTNAIALDFQGPTFSISVTPNPAKFPKVATINVTASETLLAIPTVSISPKTTADFVTQNGLAYTFTFLVTGNGWTEVVPWLESGAIPDTINPTIIAIVPTAGATGVPLTSDMIIQVTDNVLITTASLMVTIDGHQLVSGGIVTDTTTYNAVIGLSSGGYTVTISPVQRLIYNQTVSLELFVKDWQENSANVIYSFTTAEDIYPPVIVPVSPTSGATLVPTTSMVVFEITDIGGVVTGSLFVTINGKQAIASGSSADPASYDITYALISDGVRVTIDPLYFLGSQEIITVDIEVLDTTSNRATLAYSFKTEDVTPPTIDPVSPTAGAIQVSANTLITIDITDFSLVLPGSVMVTINGTLAVSGGITTDPASFNLAMVALPEGYQVRIQPNHHLPYNRTVTVTVEALDNAYNRALRTYQFMVEPDIYLPSITPVFPTANARFVPTPSSIIIDLQDLETGIATASIGVVINTTPAITAGVVSSGFGTGSIVAVGNDGYRVTITPLQPFSFWSIVTMQVTIRDQADTPNSRSLIYTFRTAANPAIVPQLSLKIYLQGYYNPLTDSQRPATINIQFRETRFGPELYSYSAPLSSTGETPLIDLYGLPAQSYYMVIFHEIPGQPLGVNHVPLMINDPQPFTGSFPAILDLRTSPNAYFYTSYISPYAVAFPGKTPDPFYTESNGKRSLRSGNIVFDSDTAINIVDFMKWRNEWQAYAGAGSPADLNGDGVVDTLDFAIWSYNTEHMYPVDR